MIIVERRPINLSISRQQLMLRGRGSSYNISDGQCQLCQYPFVDCIYVDGRIEDWMNANGHIGQNIVLMGRIMIM